MSGKTKLAITGSPLRTPYTLDRSGRHRPDGEYPPWTDGQFFPGDKNHRTIFLLPLRPRSCILFSRTRPQCFSDSPCGAQPSCQGRVAPPPFVQTLTKGLTIRDPTSVQRAGSLTLVWATNRSFPACLLALLHERRQWPIRIDQILQNRIRN